jgi:Fic family protein
MADVQFESITKVGLERRVRGEYHDMPGMRLTLAQACRLWDVDRREAERTLDRLVKSGFLQRLGPYYFRADLGRLIA